MKKENNNDEKLVITYDYLGKEKTEKFTLYIKKHIKREDLGRALRNVDKRQIIIIDVPIFNGMK